MFFAQRSRPRFPIFVTNTRHTLTETTIPRRVFTLPPTRNWYRRQDWDHTPSYNVKVGSTMLPGIATKNHVNTCPLDPAYPRTTTSLTRPKSISPPNHNCAQRENGESPDDLCKSLHDRDARRLARVVSS